MKNEQRSSEGLLYSLEIGYHEAFLSFELRIFFFEYYNLDFNHINCSFMAFVGLLSVLLLKVCVLRRYTDSCAFVLFNQLLHPSQ